MVKLKKCNPLLVVLKIFGLNFSNKIKPIMHANSIGKNIIPFGLIVAEKTKKEDDARIQMVL